MSATSRCRGSNWVMGRNRFANKMICVSVTMFEPPIATVENDRSIHGMCSSAVSNYRADQNARSSSMAITGMS